MTKKDLAENILNRKISILDWQKLQNHLPAFCDNPTRYKGTRAIALINKYLNEKEN